MNSKQKGKHKYPCLALDSNRRTSGTAFILYIDGDITTLLFPLYKIVVGLPPILGNCACANIVPRRIGEFRKLPLIHVYCLHV